jgi:two-component system sensor histidine kinase PilS (NtrC family)
LQDLRLSLRHLGRSTPAAGRTAFRAILPRLTLTNMILWRSGAGSRNRGTSGLGGQTISEVNGNAVPLFDAGNDSAVKQELVSEAGERTYPRRVILRWVYLVRIGLAGGLFAGAALAWSAASAVSPAQTLAASLALVLTLIITPFSYWHTHVRRKPAGSSFVYAQAIFDVVLVTLVVHLTGGRDSVIPPFFILLISAYTLVLPFRGGFLVTGLACMAYTAEVVWGQGTTVDTVVALQLGIFVGVALVVGLISHKLLETGAELTSVEHALEQLRLDTGDILGNIPTAVLTIDGEGRLAYANPAAEQLLGIEAGSWMERPVLDELASRSAGLRRALERTRDFRIPVASGEIEVKRDGETIPVGISTAVLERREGRPSVTAMMRDISDRKRVEQLRQRTERLEAVAELSASLAHEIKNPLASISSSVQQLELKEEADDDDRTLSRLILKESDRLSRLLSDFIEFARVRIERPQKLDLREVTVHALSVVRQHPACSGDVELETKFDPDPVLFEGDEDLMHRVVTNLVLNAVQAGVSGRKTKVEVEVFNGGKEGLPEGFDIVNPIFLRVCDNGSGIPETDLTRIFDPFFSTRTGGSGLGLAIVHRAVREHQGTVLVTSNERTGTRFTICLPGNPPPASQR